MIAKRLFAFCVMLLLILGLSTPAIAQNSMYYVSPSGSDANPGTQTQPWLTIQKAASAMPEGGEVTVLEGDYLQTVSVSRSNLTFLAQGHVLTRGFYITGDGNIVKGFDATNPSGNAAFRVTGDNNLIEGNDIHNTGQDGIWFFGNNNIYRHNYIHDIVEGSTGTHIDCLQTWGPVSNAVFDSNICYNSKTTGSNQIVMVENLTPPVDGLIFLNNIFIMEDPGYSPMNFQRKDGQQAVSNITIVNNTIVHRNGIGQYGVWLSAVTNATVRNNLFIDYGTQYDPYVLVDRGSTGVVISNNAVYKTDGAAPKGGAQPGDVWMQDPKVVSISGSDFHIQAGSPLIDRGYNVGNLNIQDFDYNIRPQGAAYDIGAYEYAGVQPATNTPAPQTSTFTPLPPTVTRTPTMTRTNTPVPSDTGTVAPSSTNTPVPTDTPTPTVVNTPECVVIAVYNDGTKVLLCIVK